MPMPPRRPSGWRGEHIVELLDQSIDLTEAGRGRAVDPLDVARIAALRNQRQADIPSLEAERAQAAVPPRHADRPHAGRSPGRCGRRARGR
jgi:hypothetical protein